MKKVIKIISVVGARPNFMKISPFINQINNHNTCSNIKIKHLLVHTGQHYDDKMSNVFFEQLGIPKSDINLGIGSGTHAEQVGKTMISFEKVLQEENPDWVIVVGDVNATLACSITAKKLNIKVCHIESGLRSRDELMPEEINRLVTDRISDLLLTPDMISSDNLLNEGVPAEKIKFVGNIMIDTLDSQINKAKKINLNNIIKSNFIINQKCLPSINNISFGLITLHRPSNVDILGILEPIIRFFLDEVTKDYVLIWPIHPRTKQKLIEFNLWEKILNCEKMIILNPLSYHEMLKLNLESNIMFTDSGGLQEECTILGTPCLTLRYNTERPITLCENGGASILTGNKIKDIKNNLSKIIEKNIVSSRPKYWDGNTAKRCLKEIINFK
tara:strand:- start:7773 stop:8933 length:1161 start_codon:yes stop_codon:yes gene_type:complete